MDDLRDRLRLVERNSAPDLWAEIKTRSPQPEFEPHRRRWPVIALVAAVVVAAFSVAFPLLRPLQSGSSGAAANGGILYEVWRRVDSGPDLWIVRPDGSGATMLLREAEGGIWSPDGNHIAFIESKEGGGVWMMNADGSDLHELTDEYGAEHLLWAPDGRSIMFAEPSGKGIYSIDVPTGDVTQFVAGPFWSPSFSPDGQRLVLVKRTNPGTARENRSELFVVDIDGSDLRQLTSDGGYYGSAAWSPRGDMIAADWTPQTRPYGESVYLVDPRSGERSRLTKWKGWNTAPVWSPDGRYIAFASNRGVSAAEPDRLTGGGHGRHELSVYVMRADGSDLRQVVEGRMSADPTGWS